MVALLPTMSVLPPRYRVVGGKSASLPHIFIGVLTHDRMTTRERRIRRLPIASTVSLSLVGRFGRTPTHRYICRGIWPVPPRHMIYEYAPSEQCAAAGDSASTQSSAGPVGPVGPIFVSFDSLTLLRTSARARGWWTQRSASFSPFLDGF